MEKQSKPKKVNKKNHALEEFFKATKEIYLRDGGLVTTVVIGSDWITTPEKTGLIAIQLANDASLENRASVLKCLGAAAQVANKFDILGKIKFVGISSEGWMSKQEAKGKKFMRPSEDVNKKEVLITSVSYGKGEVETKIAEIKKQFKDDDIVTTITENKVDYSGKSESPLLDGFWKAFGGKSLPEIPEKFRELAKKDPEGMLNNILEEAMRVAEKF